MKTNVHFLRLIFILTIYLPFQSFGQQWNWEWSGSISKHGEFAWMEAQSCDLLNNIYCVASYDSILYLPDTTFIHPEQYPETYCNKAILKYNFRGEFVNALDLYTIPGAMIYNAQVGAGMGLDIYISATFSWRLFIQDTIINHIISPYPDLADGVVLKLTPDFEIVWAKLIGSPYSDQIYDSYVTHDEDMYVLTEHVCDEGTQVIFFEQDTVISDADITSVSKLDMDGYLEWHKDFYGMISAYFITQGSDGLLYLWGTSYTNIIVDNDTIFHPNPSEFVAKSFFTSLHDDGMIEQIEFVDYGVHPYTMVVNSSGERYISSSLHDTVIISADTIIVPGNSYYYGFIGKFDAQMNPLWYKVIPTVANQTLGITQMAMDEDHLIFSVSSNDDLHIADTVIPINQGSEAFVGEFSPDGELLNIIRSESNLELASSNLLLDNCNNPIISGYFRGRSYLGPDTLNSFLNSEADGFVAKINRVDIVNINLGPDTLACATHTLYGPAGYLYYSWNDTITNQNSYTATETGTISFACANEDGCWLYDTINVQIHPGFTIDLGPDTSIFQNEFIIFTVPEGYDSYLWSNTVTANSISVFGESYPPGTIKKIWVQVTDGPCIISDTVYVTIKSEFSVEDNLDSGIFLYPNPSYDLVYIKANTAIDQIEICDLNGLTLSSMEFQSSPGEMIRISLKNLNRGVYILKLNCHESQAIKKIIKL